MQNTNWDHEIKPLLTAFGKFIKQKRNELGLSQEELATRSGLHRTYISDVERGIRNLTLGAAWFLARGLSMSLADLLANVKVPAQELQQSEAGNLAVAAASSASSYDRSAAV